MHYTAMKDNIFHGKLYVGLNRNEHARKRGAGITIKISSIREGFIIIFICDFGTTRVSGALQAP